MVPILRMYILDLLSRRVPGMSQVLDSSFHVAKKLHLFFFFSGGQKMLANYLLGM